MRCVLINQFFPPAQAPTGRLLYELATELVRRGHAVTVLTSAAGYGGEGNVAPGESAGMRVIRIGHAGRHGSRIGGKFSDYLAFFRGVSQELARQDPPDALVCMTTPPFLGLLGVHGRNRFGVPYVLWCMDLYPEALIAHGFLRPWNPLTLLLRRLARMERGQAATVVTLGPDMTARLQASGASRAEEIPVWSGFCLDARLDEEARKLRRERGWSDDEIVLLYSGNMGRAHDAGEFAALAGRLRGATPRCRFVFAGDGPARSEWERRWHELFEFMPTVSGDLCAAHLRAADIHLVSQRPEWTGVVVPSKFQAACALGRPVVFAGPPHSAVGTWLTNANAGWILPSGDMAALDAAATELLASRQREEKGRQAFYLYKDIFTPIRNCGMIANLVEQVAQKQP